MDFSAWDNAVFLAQIKFTDQEFEQGFVDFFVENKACWLTLSSVFYAFFYLLG